MQPPCRAEARDEVGRGSEALEPRPTGALQPTLAQISHCPRFGSADTPRNRSTFGRPSLARSMRDESSVR